MNSLSKLNVTGIPLLRLRWSPHKAQFKFEESILSNPRDPLYAQVAGSYDRVPSDTFRWKITANVGGLQKSKAVIRRRVKRRWTAAFQQALKESGLENDGRPRDDTQRSVLRGTLEVYAFGGLDYDYKKLMAQTRLVVQGVRRAVEAAETVRDGQKTTKDEGIKAREDGLAVATA